VAQERKIKRELWLLKNPEYYNQYFKDRGKADLKFNLGHRMRTAINTSLRGCKKGRHWENLVGYTFDDLLKRLNKTMPEGYTWDNYLNSELHIDHIIPISKFNFTTSRDADFKRCWALDNLRLLPAEENLRKGNR